MTDIMEARRKGFEEFYLTQDTEAAEHLNFIRDDGEYGYHVTRLAWYCWNQSLNSVCVELPEFIGMNQPFSETPISEIRAQNHFNKAIELCREAIERAGLKVKP